MFSPSLWQLNELIWEKCLDFGALHSSNSFFIDVKNGNGLRSMTWNSFNLLDPGLGDDFRRIFNVHRNTIQLCPSPRAEKQFLRPAKIIQLQYSCKNILDSSNSSRLFQNYLRLTKTVQNCVILYDSSTVDYGSSRQDLDFLELLQLFRTRVKSYKTLKDSLN